MNWKDDEDELAFQSQSGGRSIYNEDGSQIVLEYTQASGGQLRHVVWEMTTTPVAGNDIMTWAATTNWVITQGYITAPPANNTTTTNITSNPLMVRDLYLNFTDGTGKIYFGSTNVFMQNQGNTNILFWFPTTNLNFDI